MDSDSTDDSAEKATKAGARGVRETQNGYGRAFRRGLEAAEGEVLAVADADGTNELSTLHRSAAEPARRPWPWTFTSFFADSRTAARSCSQSGPRCLRSR